MRKWVLIDVDGTGLREIEAADDHPERQAFNDDDALSICRRAAKRGHKEAIEACAQHDRDASALRAYRNYGRP